jgi:hypothetical protein
MGATKDKLVDFLAISRSCLVMVTEKRRRREEREEEKRR